MMLLLITLILMVGDAITTYWIINDNGTEKNPVMAKLIAEIGLIPAIAVSKGLAGSAAIYLYISGAELFLFMLIVLHGWVVAHNLKQIR